MEKLKPYFPILTWGPQYQKSYIVRDLIAGITVALTVVPQGLAYASLARLPTEYGLYTSYVSAIIYTFLGSSKDLAVGPQSLMSLLTAEYCMRPENWVPLDGAGDVRSDPRLAILLCMCSGAVILFLGVFNLGGIVNFISHPVLVGFISAASVVIPMGLLERVFGISGLPANFVMKMIELAKRLGETKYLDATFGFATLFVLLALKHAKIRFSTVNKDDGKVKVVAKKILWITATLRNAFVLFVTSTILFVSQKNCPFGDEDVPANETDRYDCITPTTISAITLPSPALPDTSIALTDSDEQAGLGDMLSTLGSGIIIVPFVAILQSIGIGKSLAERGNYKVTARNDFFAVGIGGLASSLVSSMPVSGCFSRSSLNFESNAATQLGNVITAAVVLVSALVFAEYFRWIPTASLAAVIMAAVGSMFDWDAIMEVVKLSKRDAVPMILTFVLSVYDFRIGIVVGIMLHIGMLIYDQNSPDIHITDDNKENSVRVTLEHGIAFPVCENLLDTVNDELEAKPETDLVIIDLKNAYTADVAAARTLKKLSVKCTELDIRLKIINANEHLREMLGKLDVTILEKSEDDDGSVVMRKNSNHEAILEGFDAKPLREQQLIESARSLHGSSTQIHFK